MPFFFENHICRSCRSTRLQEVLNLGEIYLSAFLRPDEPDPPKTPIVLMLCESCTLLQLKHYIDPDVHFKTFHYLSGLTTSMRAALLDVVEQAGERVQIYRGDTVVDIGSNDSTLLSFWEPTLERIGFEPATNLMEVARQDPDLLIVNDYWSYPSLRVMTGKKARVITCIACFYDVNDPNAFLADVRKALADRNSLFIIQLTSLSDMLTNNDIGNLTQEHVCHYSLLSLEQLLEAHGLYAFDVSHNDVNGGSLRIYASPELRSPTASLVMQRHFERRSGFGTPAVYNNFAARALDIKQQVCDLVQNSGGTVGLLGASTKANLMIDYWGLTKMDLPFASERDTRKLGLQMSAGRIPILSEFEARERADSFLVMPYGFRKEIIQRECGWLKQGGELIFPLPNPDIVSKCDAC